MPSGPAIYDAIIVGAGPAGLTAAVYLGRFRRRCLVLTDGQSRARWIPTSHNIPGFTAGIGGEEFLSSLKRQALQYGAQIREAPATTLDESAGDFSLATEQGTYRSRYVLLATGVKDRLPPIKGAAEAVLRSLLRVCPICDAFEAIDKRIAIIADGPLGEREAQFLKHYSNQVTLLQTVSDAEPPAQAAGYPGVERLLISMADLRIEDRQVRLKVAEGHRSFDVVYIALGCSSQTQLVRPLKILCDEDGTLKVNRHQETSLAGLYAAGDVVRGLNQVIVAAAEAAIAATDIHNKLRTSKPAGSHRPQLRGAIA
jgi:thioredoxin reductase (NADPH)